MRPVALAMLAALDIAFIAIPVERAGSDIGNATVQRIGFGGGHRHGSTAGSPSTKKPEPPHAPPPPETAEQHRAYLRRYGFSQ